MTNEPLSIPALLVAIRNLRIEGVSVEGWAGLPAEQRHDDLHAALDLALHHPRLFEVAASYDLADVGMAVAHSKRTRKVGAVLLTSPAR